jgi:glycosyltransferase involved in cell wall biosynthesis
MNKKVVLLSTNLARGGAETQVALLAAGLRGRGWEASVVSMLEPSAFQEELASAGVPVYSLKMRPGSASPAGFLRLASLLRKLRPQILHCHMFHANLLGRMARLIAPVPVAISTAHSLVESCRESGDARGRERWLRRTDRLSDVTVAVCDAIARRCAESRIAPQRKIRVIPNGVDTVRIQPDAEAREDTRRELKLGHEFVWLAAGRLLWKKDYPTMLRAFAAQGKGRLLIAGEGPEEAALRALAGELKADVRFLGLRADAPKLMNACNGYLLSSNIEGLPMALLEAAASGAPSVATGVGGVGEIVLDGQTGYLVPPGDAGAFGAAMTRLQGLTPKARQQMGQAAREHVVERFEMARVVGRWEQLYEELAGARR